MPLFSDFQKQTLRLLADGEFHSGTEIARMLGLSRSAIWKHLNYFNELGITHAAVSGKGYRLHRPLELLCENQIRAALTPQAQAMIAALDIHDHIHSTNTHLSSLARQQASSGSICLAEYQSAGRGRRGRQWVSPYGHNIYLSLLWHFQQGPAALSGLSLAVGVAVIRALKQLNIDNVQLKWPNDIFSNGQKLGGILLEVSGETEGPCYAVVGLGLNVYLPETEASGIDQAWTDLENISKNQHSGRNVLTAELLNQVLPVVAGYEQHAFKHYVDEWRTCDSLKDKPAVLVVGQHQVNGVVRGIDDDGLLLLEKSDGSVQAFASGEVSFHKEKQ